MAALAILQSVGEYIMMDEVTDEITCFYAELIHWLFGRKIANPKNWPRQPVRAFVQRSCHQPSVLPKIRIEFLYDLIQTGQKTR